MMFGFSRTQLAVLRACRREPMSCEELATELNRGEPWIRRTIKELRQADLLRPLADRVLLPTQQRPVIVYVAVPAADEILRAAS